VGDFLQELDGGLAEIDEVSEERLAYRRCQIIEQTQKRVPSSFTQLLRFHVSNEMFFLPMQQSGNFRFLNFNFLRGTSDDLHFTTY